MDWLTFKRHIADFTVHKDALHVYAAFIIQVSAALVTRKSLGSIVPWLAVLAAELFNESLDLLFEKEAYIHRWQIVGSAHDIVNTMMLPTLLILLARYRPQLFGAASTEAPPR